MKRIVWIAVTILIMLGIMGFGLHTLNNINETNKRRREKEQGEQLASQFAVTTATTSVWDILRQTTVATNPGDDFQNTVPEEADPVQTRDVEIVTEPAPEEPVVPDVITEAPVQTSTVTTGLIVHIN